MDPYYLFTPTGKMLAAPTALRPTSKRDATPPVKCLGIPGAAAPPCVPSHTALSTPGWNFDLIWLMDIS